MQAVLRAEDTVALGSVIDGEDAVFLIEQPLHGVAVVRHLQKAHAAGQCAQCLDLLSHAVGKAVCGGLVGKGAPGGIALRGHSPGGQPRTHGIRNKAQLDEIVERSLRGAAIWDEVKDRLNKSALGMSGGQQQRLCIARALAVEPEVLLMDEPTSALDPISTSKVEELATELKENYTIVMVTHNMQQAARISDKTAFFLLGELVEMGPTERVFATPVDKRTEDYISGRFG